MKKIAIVVLSVVCLCSILAPTLLADGEIILPIVHFNTNEPGDVNGDKEVNNKDVVLLFRYVSGDKTVDVVTKNIDVNGDKQVDNKDVVNLFRICSETQSA